MRNIIFTLIIISCFKVVNFSQCNSDSLKIIQTRAKDTDTGMTIEFSKHYSFYNPTCVTKNTLILHLGGSYGKPANTIVYPSMAANNGFHVIGLKYRNTVAAKTACGTSTDTNCFIKFRKEILEGIDYSTQVSVDFINSIYNRFIKLLHYLHNTNPTQNWNQYFTGNTILWNKIIVSGHSQGGGHAGLIGVLKPVKRVLMFASPNDYNTLLNISAPWLSLPKMTADSLFYGFNNLNDNVVPFSEQFQNWNKLGMHNHGDSVNVDNIVFPYSNSRQLYTKRINTIIPNANHSLMLLDTKTPYIGTVAVFEPVWQYMIGITSLASVNEINSDIRLSIYPNPTNSSFTIETDEKILNIDIYTILGKKIESFSTKNIDINHLTNGIYNIIIQTDEVIICKKIVKY